MSRLLTCLPLLAVLAAGSALAASPDPHAGHHPDAPAAAAPAEPEADAGSQKACAVMNARMAPQMDSMKGEAKAQGMAKGGQGGTMTAKMSCMQGRMPAAPAPGTAPDAEHDHNHPAK